MFRSRKILNNKHFVQLEKHKNVRYCHTRDEHEEWRCLARFQALSGKVGPLYRNFLCRFEPAANIVGEKRVSITR